MWADSFIEKLNAGETVSFRPRGNSMSGKIKSGSLCTVSPSSKIDISVGDIVLCKVKGSQYLHIVKAKDGDRYKIGNNHGKINGWCSKDAIYGVLKSVSK